MFLVSVMRLKNIIYNCPIGLITVFEENSVGRFFSKEIKLFYTLGDFNSTHGSPNLSYSHTTQLSRSLSFSNIFSVSPV